MIVLIAIAQQEHLVGSATNVAAIYLMVVAGVAAIFYVDVLQKINTVDQRLLPARLTTAQFHLA
jgi:hypothetical protein